MSDSKLLPPRTVGRQDSTPGGQPASRRRAPPSAIPGGGAPATPGLVGAAGREGPAGLLHLADLPPFRRATGREGFVLVAVLWLLVALGAVGIHTGLELRSERLATANRLDEARAREAALAGAEYARSRLSAAMLDVADELRAEVEENARSNRRRRRNRTLSVDRLFSRADPIDDPWRDPAGLVMPEMAFGDAEFSVQVRDAGAALHLNEADEEMLRGFFSQGLELDYALADRITQAVLDWRDEDDLPRLGGAEREEYLREGAPVLPPNRPFASTDELRFVLGVTPEIYRAAEPHLTVVGSGRINVNAAEVPVLSAVPGITRQAAIELLRLREGGVFPSDFDQLESLLPASVSATLDEMGGRRFRARADFHTNEVEVVSEGRVSGGAVTTRVRTILIRSDQGALLIWRSVE